MNLFELFVKVDVDDQASGKLKELGGKLGDGLKTAAKIGTAAVSMAAAGITALTTAAVKNYAEYEQLVGGVQTLFGLQGKSLEEYAATVGKTTDEALDEWLKYTTGERKILNYAEEAYKNAGLSMNQYMETVTSFSASLIASLGGDTAAAADYANMAIVDMADNANKMGTSMEMLQTTYAGFAKQNYTMLDNLKLGYGGTKTEMERLLKDAEKLPKAMGKKFDISNYADVVEAIHLVQENMGIAGATAAEAASTIEGSLATAKAAWQNLVTGIADDNADFETLLNNFVESVGIAGKNILPRIKIALDGASKLIQEIIPKIVQAIPEIVATNLPALLEAAMKIVKSMASGIDENKDLLLDTIFDVVSFLAENIFEALPKALQMGIDLLHGIVDGFADAIPDILPAAVKCIDELANTLTNPDNLSKVLNSGGRLLFEVANGIVSSIPNLLDTAIDIVKNLTDYIANDLNLEKVINSGITLLENLIIGLTDPETLSEINGAVSQFTDAVMKAVENVDWIGVGKRLAIAILKGVAGIADYIAEEIVRGDLFVFLGDLLGDPGMFQGKDTMIDKVRRAHGVDGEITPTMSYAVDLLEESLEDKAESEKAEQTRTTIVQNIYASTSTAADLMEEAIYQAERAMRE